MSSRGSRRLSLNVFTQFSMSHSYSGCWRLPDASGNRGYTDVDTWVDVARTAEAACFDAIFFADGLGAGGHSAGDLEKPLREGQYMRMDPSVLVPALAMVTQHLGFVVTSAMIQDHPFHFARRMSTLDHITRGRIGWNVVTSFNPGAWANLGLSGDMSHDERYRWAQEYMEVVYKLWEGSWEPGAGVHDLAGNRWVDPELVHTIDHVGDRYSVRGPHMVEPSPQGSPVIFQAGASPAGRDFAARHAEMQFIGGTDPDKARAFTQDVVSRAVRQGRGAGDVLFAPSMAFAVGSTEEEAHRKRDEYVAALSLDGVAAKLNTQLGIDFTALDPGTPLTSLRTDGIQSTLDSIIEAFPNGAPTVEELLVQRATGSMVVGTPEQIADRLTELHEAGIDGVLVSLVTRPGSLDDFVEHVVPELRRRGLVQTEYTPGTLRHKLFGRGDRLPENHPAAAYRHRSAMVPA